MTACSLCGLPIEDPIETESIDGSFCCGGCLAVARSLANDDSTVDLTDINSSSDAAPVEEPSGETAFLRIGGMHCTACELYVGDRLMERDGVIAAEASFPAGLARVQFDPDRIDPSTIAETRIPGYDVTEASAESVGETEAEAAEGRLLVGVILGMMVMVHYFLFLYPVYLGTGIQLMPLTGPAGAYLLWTVWGLASVVLFYSAAPLLRGAWVSLRTRHPDMDLLVAIAAGTAYLYSTVALLAGRTELYVDVTVVVVVAVGLGRYYERRIARRAVGRLTDLVEGRVETARRLVDGTTERIPVADLSAGERIEVRPGERIPVDGTVVAGAAGVDTALVTGESRPVRRAPGDEIIGGARLVEGRLEIEAAGDGSTLDRLLATLWSVRAGQSGTQHLADRLAAVFVPFVIALGIFVGVVHIVAGATPTAALLTGLAVLVVSCPCALGLATPLAIAAGVRDALDRGIVVTSGEAFERVRQADIVAFDKTGTLTSGTISLQEAIGGDRAMALAAAVERHATHPLAEAVTTAFDAADTEVTDVQRVPGRGVTATVGTRRVMVGHRDLFVGAEALRQEWEIPTEYQERYETAAAEGDLPAYVGLDGRVEGVLVGTDDPRETWESTLAAFKDRAVVILTGDDSAAADRFRASNAVDAVHTGVTPERKAAIVAGLRDRGTVAMVGDGDNDAPALAAADTGIALASGTAIAAEAADAVVLEERLSATPDVFALTEATRRRVRENLGWAFVYNLVALPAAALGLLNPAVAAVAMAGSSLLVVANSARPLGTSRNDDTISSPTMTGGDLDTAAATTGGD